MINLKIQNGFVKSQATPEQTVQQIGEKNV